MPKTLTAFTHLDESFTKGQDVDDAHPLVELAPHLFEQPDPEPVDDGDEPVRIRGPLVVVPPSKSGKSADTTTKEA